MKWLVITFSVLLVLFWQTPPLRMLQGADIMPLWLHTFVETFSIVVAMLIFGVGWNAYSKDRSGNIIILACAFLAVGLIDFAHIISYNGMPDFITPAGREKGINFWLAARLLAALALLVAAVRPPTPLSNPSWRYVLLAGCLAITALVYWMGLFHQPLWPRTFIEGQGLTPFKIAVEYSVIAILTVPAGLFYTQARKTHANEASNLFVAASIFILSELCFTLYSDVRDAMNLLGHAYKVVAFMFLYRAIFVSSVREPFQKLNEEIAERKLVEAALKKSLQEVEDLYHNAPCGYHSLDKDGIFLQINDTELGWLGYTREELLERKTRLVDVLSPASARTFHENYPTFMQRGWINDLEYEFVRKDGTTFPVLLNATAVMDGDGSYLMSRSTSFDITERKQVEIALEHRNRFYLVLSRVNEAIVRTAERDTLFENICRIAVENGKFAMVWIGLMDEIEGEIFPAASWGHDAGYLDYLQTTGVLGLNGPTCQAIKSGEFRLSQNIAADPRMTPWRQEALKRGYYSSAAFPLRRGGKVVGTINFYAGQPDAFDSDVLSLLKDLSADISFALSAMDQRERRHAAEERLRQLNEELEQRVAERTRQLEAANKELEAFSYSVSHDLRSPLRSIDGFSEILEKKYAERLDDNGKDYLGRVRRASKRMGELIDDLLLLARVTRAELHKETVDLSRMVQAMAREMQEAAPQRQVEWVIQDGIVAQADSRLIKAVLENLLANAWKFTAHQTTPRIEFGIIEQEDEKIIFMRDNGAGFDMKYASKLFGAFQRLHKAEDFEGTGIGLATVQRIIHRHGGRIWAEAQIGAGATFYFVI